MAGATFVAPEGWRAIDFISDLHLAGSTPRTFEAWASHMRHTSADAVFILGDLFEAWVGDDVAAEGFEARCLDVLTAAASRIGVAFMAGNRDFLVGDALLARHAVHRLADPTVISAFGTRVLASHGDALCVGDVAYQRYRRIVRRPGLQRAFLSLPRGWRRAAGLAMRRRSGEVLEPTLRQAIDIDAVAGRAWLESAAAQALVHGHTHAAASHAMGPAFARHVLSDWDLESAAAPRAEVLRWSAVGFSRVAPQTGSTAGAPPP